MTQVEGLSRERAARVAKPSTIGILISGRGSNMAALLEAIKAGCLSARCAAVISDNPAAPGLALARNYGVEALALDPTGFPSRTEFQTAIASELTSRGVELVCLAGFMRIVRRPLLEAFPGRIMNIHPSLLPAFPGLHAQAQAVEYGVRVAGCTVHLVDEGMDTGPIILQAAVPVLGNDTADSLAARILTEEHRLYPLAVQLYAEGRLQVEGRRVRILEG